MLITGFEDYPLVDGSHLLDDPVFWALHALQLGVIGLTDIEEAFGVDIGDAAEIENHVFDHDRWPVFTVPCAAQATSTSSTGTWTATWAWITS